ncbi:MAG TPA: lasso peptide biosynthesis B2 protein [Sphingomonas sp.]|uniref:lasso peptide biosynthesis B2 protein n=1 Tax=Sphingomonas sp. TaxID=28214 RepID=UPI002BF793AB|nr:lasso peptide biosynthesis B2 protein [Sphingomonas sp.]HMI20851.1 lasso peptide biosynthesis B2 protein [Sphingomonas sp.]
MPRRSLYEAPANSRFFPTLRALAGYLSARWKLRYCGLAASLRSLEARKSRIAARPDAQAMADAVAGDFRRAAMLATTRNYCLPHSLAVANALFTRNVPADLVLGVRTRPFGAHCWVQFHEAVVNDSIDNVRDYIPIRVI